MKIFISQPMTGLDEEDILFTRAKEKAKARLMFGDDVEFCDNYMPEANRADIQQRFSNMKCEWDIVWLGQAIIYDLATADVVWLVSGWENSKGCQIEREIAEMYGLDVYYPAYF